MIRFAALGSGSRGNAMAVQTARTTVLIDCGFGPRELSRRLGRLGLTADMVDAILVTHEHSDHIGGAAACARRYDIPLYMTHGTHSAGLRHDASAGGLDIHLIDSHVPFGIGDFEVQPFPVPHDAREPVQFVFTDGVRRLGLLTDTGHVTPHVVAMLAACDALVIECNHDAEMLVRGAYPWPLKQRIAGRFGHLDNQAAAALLGALDRARLQHVVAAHLSEHNNTPQLAREALAGVLGCVPAWVGVATQEEGFSWRELI